MNINPPQHRGPFSDPLTPLAPNKKAGELEEIQLKDEPVLASSGGNFREGKRDAPTGFSALPIEVEKEEAKEEAKAHGVVLTATEEFESPERAPRWKFWQRPKRRDEQLAILQDGCAEMVGVMRSMKDELADSRDERVGVKTSLSPLPVAVASLQSLSKTQEKTGQILEELKACVEKSSSRENSVAESLGSFNEAMASVGRTFVGLEKRSERSIEALDRLSKRVEQSDLLHQTMFERMRESEHEFADQLGRASQRGAFIMVSACGLVGLAMIFMTVSLNQRRHAMDFASLPSPVEVAKAQVHAAGPPAKQEERVDAPEAAPDVEAPQGAVDAE